MIEQEEQPIVDSLVRDHMVVIQDEDNFPRVLHEFIEQGRQDGREWGGASGECSMARAIFPTLGRQVRSAAMTEAQKRIGSLSSSSRESQATSCSSPPALLPLACGFEDAAIHAESSVVFPLPAEAETSVS